MSQSFLNRKNRYGIRKFTIGVASVVIGSVLFGITPVLAQETITNIDVRKVETPLESGASVSESVSEVVSGGLNQLDKDLVGRLASATDNGVEVNKESLKKETPTDQGGNSENVPAEPNAGRGDKSLYPKRERRDFQFTKPKNKLPSCSKSNRGWL